MPRLARTTTSAILAALALGSWAPPSAGDRGPELERYVDLVEHYAKGDRAGALAALGDWRERDLETATGLVAAWSRGEAEGPSGVDRAVFGAFPLASAILLHAERARNETVQAKVTFHLDLAWGLARLLPDDPRHREFVRRFSVVITLWASQTMRWELALDLAKKVLRLFPGDPELLLAVGRLEEQLGFQGAPRSDPPPPGYESLTAVDLWERTGRQRHLAEAEKALAAAVAGDPRLLEARLRLGRVQWRRGAPEAARAQLEAVLAASRDAALVSLAHLFLGRIHEDGRRFPEAAREYEAALAVAPRAQTPRIALAHLRHRQGDEAGCRAIVLQAAEPTGSADDFFWSYRWGWPAQAEALFEVLVAEASR